MKINKKAILFWCDSVESTWSPREGMKVDNPKQVPEQFLATAIRYLRALCENND